jgi:hypothetical protein
MLQKASSAARVAVRTSRRAGRPKTRFWTRAKTKTKPVVLREAWGFPMPSSPRSVGT